MEFAGFLGNSHLKRRLSASLDSGRSSHCYALCGPAGSGKQTLATLLAATLQCTGQVRPCGQCAHCRKVMAGIHPDVLIWDEPDKKEVPVALIRRLQTDAFLRPNEGQRKIYILPRAHDLNDSSGNALLKLIEEPPSYAVFLLLADNPNRLLPTIRSRCVELRLEPVPKEDALPWLSAQFPEQSPEALMGAYRQSGGWLGQAMTLLQGTIYAPQTLAFARAFAQKDTLALTETLCAMEKTSRADLLSLLHQWRSLLTNALMVQAGLTGSREASDIAHNRTGRELSHAVEILQQAQDACNANAGVGHLCGWLAVTLR